MAFTSYNIHLNSLCVSPVVCCLVHNCFHCLLVSKHIRTHASCQQDNQSISLFHAGWQHKTIQNRHWGKKIAGVENLKLYKIT